MKTVILKIILLIGKIISYIYPLYASRKITIIKSAIYTARICGSFKKSGKNGRIGYPSMFIGSRYICIGNRTYIGKNAVITAWDRYMNDLFNPQINIGDNVIIGQYCHITAINKINIGNNVLTGRWVTITDNSHGRTDAESLLIPPKQRALHSPGYVVIEDNVWIGDKVTILPNVHIGKNSIIGANSVVTKDIPANCVAIGIPAVIKKHI
jgi:acetyltransferase-like isoleucine patch superfamily enzyme